MTPAMEVLLELVSDFVERALFRLGSPLAPAKAPVPRTTSMTAPSAHPSQVAARPSTIES
jgi:hypothetical protein